MYECTNTRGRQHPCINPVATRANMVKHTPTRQGRRHLLSPRLTMPCWQHPVVPAILAASSGSRQATERRRRRCLLYSLRCSYHLSINLSRPVYFEPLLHRTHYITHDRLQSSLLYPPFSTCLLPLRLQSDPTPISHLPLIANSSPSWLKSTGAP